MLSRTFLDVLHNGSNAQVEIGISFEELERIRPLLEDLVDSVTLGRLENFDRNRLRSCLALPRFLQPKSIVELKGIELPRKNTPINQRLGSLEVPKDTRPSISHFQINKGCGPRKLFLAYFGIDAQAEEAELWAVSNDYRLALIEDLLAVGNHPKHRRLLAKFPILQLGSRISWEKGPRSWDHKGEHPLVAYLSECGRCRAQVDVGRLSGGGAWACSGGGWGSTYRFLLYKAT